MKNIIILVMLSLFLISCDDNNINDSKFANDIDKKYERTKWFREAKLGAIIHYAPGVLTGKELSWSRAGKRRDMKDSSWYGYGTVPLEIYDNLYKEFTAEKFDPEEWILILKAAGLKYVVFTTKHWDGFCNFDSKHTDYKITNPECPYGKDMVKEMVEACRKHNFRLGLYFPRPDWYHPDYFTENHGQYNEYMKNQIYELITNYGPIDLIWFDGGYPPELTNSYQVSEMLNEIQPNMIFNDRLDLRGDFNVKEFEYQDYNNLNPWEANFTLGEGWSWKPEEETKSLRQIISYLTEAVGRNGNFSLGIGPRPDGSFTDKDKARLIELGDWLRIYGEAYYSTAGGPFAPKDWGAFTYKDNVAYAHILNMPKNNTIPIPRIGNNIVRVISLHDNKEIPFILDGENNYILSVEQSRLSDICTIIKIEYENQLYRSVEYE